MDEPKQTIAHTEHQSTRKECFASACFVGFAHDVGLRFELH